MSLTVLPGKLLISMVPRHKGDLFMTAAKAAGARGGTITHGRAVVDSKLLRALSLADVQQDIVFTLLRDETASVINAVRAACRENPKKLSGIAVLLDVSGMLVRLAQNVPFQPDSAETTEPYTSMRSKMMDTAYTLLTVIVNNGYADDVMAQARTAGAKGGTILTGRGTASQADVKFFGITLVPEKEVLMIVAEKDTVTPILEAIRQVPTLAEPGGGIVYTMNVEEFILLGQ